ncbi:MAG: FtsW/RodA/SpoVE family cell cycle protein [Chloroflexota bacterium]
MSSNGNIWQRFDYPLFVVSVILVVFGVLMIRSATLDAVDPTLISRVPDQIRYALMGVVIIFALTVLDYRLLGGLHWWLYLLMVGLLALVPTFGVVGDAGARRWLNVGILIQPSEIGKIIIIITLAHHLATNYQKLGSLWALIQSLIHVMIPVLLIFIQPDLGTTIVFVVIWAVMVWGAGLRIKHIMLGIGIGIVAAPVLWTQMEPYQRSRITTFVRCSVQTCAADDDDYYNIRQAIISIGNGGVTGRGYANGTQGQLRFLRVRHTDFIFSQIAEEFGFVGSIAVMSGIGFVIMRILRGARTSVDPLGSLICYGVAGMIFFQTVVSIGMNLNLLPVTGLTLPFISSGGTALLSTMAGIGLAQSVIVRRRRLE